MPYKNKEDKKLWNILNKDKVKQHSNTYKEKHKEELETIRLNKAILKEEERISNAIIKEEKRKSNAITKEEERRIKAQEKIDALNASISKTTKLCSKCNIEKDKSLFSVDNEVKDGLNRWCKECQKLHFSIPSNRAKKTLSDIKYKTKLLKNDLYNTLHEKRKLVSFVMRPLILKRDNYKCVLCNQTTNLEVHHIIPVLKDVSRIDDINNLVTLCKHCHLYTAHDGNWRNLNTLIQDKLIMIVTP